MAREIWPDIRVVSGAGFHGLESIRLCGIMACRMAVSESSLLRASQEHKEICSVLPVAGHSAALAC